MATMRDRIGFAAIVFILFHFKLFAYSQTNFKTSRGRARLFIADNDPKNPSIAVIDLPSYTLMQRVQLPGTSLQLGVSRDSAHIGVFRDWDNQQQYFSIITTGIIPVLPVAGARPPMPAALKDGENGTMQPAVLSKNVIFINGSDAMGGADDDNRGLVYHDGWRLYLAYSENTGRIFTYRADDLNAVNPFKPANTFNLPAGHFHVIPYGNFIIAPHSNAQAAYVVASNGTTIRRYNCSQIHGAATYMSAGGAMTAVFGCNNTVLVIRNTSSTVTYLSAASPRIRDFVNGVPGVFWSSSASQRFFWRTDVRNAVPRVTGNVTHRGGIIRMLSLPNRGRFMALHSDGYLVMYDGDSGAALTSLLLRTAGFPANMTVPYLQSDTPDNHVFVSVPSLGEIYVIHVDHGGHEGHNHTPGEVPVDDEESPNLELEHTIPVGGVPTAMTLAYMPGVVSFTQS